MRAKCGAKVRPVHLSTGGKCGGETCPPCTSGATKLLSRKENLLLRCAIEESKLRLNDAEEIIRLQRIGSSFTKLGRLSGPKVGIGGIPRPLGWRSLALSLIGLTCKEQAEHLVLVGHELFQRREGWRVRELLFPRTMPTSGSFTTAGIHHLSCMKNFLTLAH